MPSTTQNRTDAHMHDILIGFQTNTHEYVWSWISKETCCVPWCITHGEKPWDTGVHVWKSTRQVQGTRSDTAAGPYKPNNISSHCLSHLCSLINGITSVLYLYGLSGRQVARAKREAVRADSPLIFMFRWWLKLSSVSLFYFLIQPVYEHMCLCARVLTRTQQWHKTKVGSLISSLQMRRLLLLDFTRPCNTQLPD